MSHAPFPFEVLRPQRDTLGETPVWCGERRRLWWVDIRAPALMCWDSASQVTQQWPMPESAGAVVTATHGHVVLALRHGLFRFDPADASLRAMATLQTSVPENRLNEARCDRQGRLWCGSMWDFGVQTRGSLYRMDADGTVTCARSDITVPNGLAFAPDGRSMYFVDTPTGRLEVADYDPQSGRPGRWRTLVEPGVVPGKPDGSVVDSDGCIWSTRSGAGCLARFTPQGRLDRTLPLPVSQPTGLAFGGDTLDTLFVTSSRQRLDAQALADEPLAGSVLALRVGVAGLPETPFAG